MNRAEATQAVAAGIGIVAGADVDFGMPNQAPCMECGGMVNLESTVTVSLIEADGSQSQSEMTEADARQLILEMGLPPPPVFCDRHEHLEGIATSRDD